MVIVMVVNKPRFAGTYDGNQLTPELLSSNWCYSNLQFVVDKLHFLHQETYTQLCRTI